jgi:acylphosphatase
MESSQTEAPHLVKIGKIARRLRITGRVQGVGYRAALCAAADARQLHGWVRNRSDGSVEAEVAGPPEAVAALIDWARCGPPAARVAAVHVEPIDAGAAHGAGFTQRPTL